ncbi:MAG: reprolysin-like metallopeptidase [Pseudomonadota bacterium]
MRIVVSSLLAATLAAVCVLTSPARADNQLYHQGRTLESLGDYEGALELYDEFLQFNKEGDEVLQARVKVPVLREALLIGVDGSLQLYLDALDARYASQTDEALVALAQLRAAYPDSHLADDALYLSGYILLMDRFNYTAAQQHMVELRASYPDSSYTDASLYVEAIALEQSGRTDEARLAFEQLRNRHAIIAIERLNLVLPRTSIQSRLWFDRAASRLAHLDQYELEATRIVEQAYLDTGHYERRVVIKVAGQNIPLLLNPSRVFKSTRFVNELGQPLDIGDIRAFDGIIDGRPDSWARVVFNGDAIQGLIRDGNTRFDLKSDTATGTLVDYNTRLADSDKIATRTGGAEPVTAPNPHGQSLQDGASAQADAAVSKFVNRVVRMSVVIDSQYDDYTSGNGVFEAMTVTAIADGIYRDELGLALQTESVVLVTNRGSDPMRVGNATMDEILHNFRDYRLRSSAIARESSLVYLLSGNRSNDNQVGLAFIDVACRTDGYDVSAATPYRQNFLLAAHEMAHNLGAEHDTDTQCASDSSKIMSPYFNSDTRQEFSSCSKLSINHSLQGSCHAPAIDLQATIGHASDSQLTAWVSNNDPTRPASAALSVAVPDATISQVPKGCSLSESGVLVCDLASLAAGDTRKLEFGLSYSQSSDSVRRVGLSVEPIVVEDALLHNNAAQIKRQAGIEYSNTTPVSSTPSGGGGGSFSLVEIALMLFLPPLVWMRWRA